MKLKVFDRNYKTGDSLPILLNTMLDEIPDFKIVDDDEISEFIRQVHFLPYGENGRYYLSLKGYFLQVDDMSTMDGIHPACLDVTVFMMDFSQKTCCNTVWKIMPTEIRYDYTEHELLCKFEEMKKRPFFNFDDAQRAFDELYYLSGEKLDAENIEYSSIDEMYTNMRLYIPFAFDVVMYEDDEEGTT